MAISSLFILFNSYFYDYLSPDEPLNADALIVEGWMPPYALELSYSEYTGEDYSHIYTSGLKSPGYYLMAMNGYLVFYLPDKIKTINSNSHHMVEIIARSEMHKEHAAHFSVYVNDSIAADFTTEKRKKKYGFKCYGNLEIIDSISIRFDNDSHGVFGDRNLYVKSIIIDGKHEIPYQYNTVYDPGKPGGQRKPNNSVSYAEIARDKLLSMGVDSSALTAIPGNRVNIRRTLVSALAVRDYLREHDPGTRSVNIVSLGAHSRRSWITYKVVLGKDYQAGIISLDDHKTERSRKRKLFRTARELAGLLFYSFLLHFY